MVLLGAIARQSEQEISMPQCDHAGLKFTNDQKSKFPRTTDNYASKTQRTLKMFLPLLHIYLFRNISHGFYTDSQISWLLHRFSEVLPDCDM